MTRRDSQEGEGDSELLTLKEENRALGEQVKHLIRTEARLYAYQEELDRQRAAYRELAEAMRDVAAATTRLAILNRATEFALYGAGLERCVVFLRTGDSIEVAAYDGYFDEASEHAIRELRFPAEATPLSFGTSHLIHCDFGTEDQELRSLAGLLRMDEFAAFALRSGFGEVVRGVLVAGNTEAAARRHPRVSQESEILNVLSALTSQVATALENVERFNRLAAQKDEVDRANTMKSAFLATMSHELRTPLNAIIGFTRLVLRKGQDQLAERQLDNLRKVERAGLDLLNLINDILDLSKVEAGRMELLPETIDLVQLVEAVVGQLKPLADRRSVRLVINASAPPPPIWTDQKRLRQVLTNLISNGIKFTPEGLVTVELRHGGGDLPIDLIVEDTGIGIGPSELKRIFEPFHQADSSMTRTVGGTGLGLAIVRQIVDLLGGSITAESTVGVGSRFTVSLPSWLPDSSKLPSDRPSRLPPVLATSAALEPSGVRADGGKR